MSTILVVGAAGFLGSSISNYFIQYTKNTIISLDNLSVNPDLRNLASAIGARNRHSFELMDAGNELFEKLLSIHEVNYIIFAISSARLNQLLIDESNSIIHAILRSGVTRVGFIFDNNSGPYSENSEAERKLEEALPLFKERDKSLYLIKTVNLIGPKQSENSFIGSSLLDLLDGKERLEEEFSTEEEEWMYIRDFYMRVASLFSVEGIPKSGVYRYSSEQLASKREIYKFVRGLILQSGFNHEFRFGNINQYSECETSTIDVQSHNWGPSAKSLEEILEHTTCWYRDNKRVWQKDE